MPDQREGAQLQQEVQQAGVACTRLAVQVWLAAACLFRTIDSVLMDQNPTPGELKSYQNFSDALLQTGKDLVMQAQSNNNHALLADLPAERVLLEAMAQERKEIFYGENRS